MISTKNETRSSRAADVVAAFERGETPQTVDGKSAIAVAMGRLGGLKGGRARAAKLSSARRSEIARNAAQLRWASQE